MSTRRYERIALTLLLVLGGAALGISDLIEHALAIARYFDRPPHLTLDLMREACTSYFVEDRDPAAA